MNGANKITLGAFVIISVTLLIGSFLALGVSKFFETRYRAMTVFDSSVEGLMVGAPVKYMGVSIGRVTRIALRDTDGYIDIYFDIFPSAMDTVYRGEPTTSKPANFLEVVQQKPLSCFLNASGIMSSAHLELSMAPGAPALPDLDFRAPRGVIYIPSRPSHVTNVIQNISIMLDELTKVDLVKLTDKLNSTLDNANEVLTNKELRDIILRLDRVSQDVESCAKNLQLAFEEENVRKIINAINYLEESLGKFHDAFPRERVDSLASSLNEFMTQSASFVENTDKSRGEVVEDIREMKYRIFQSLTRFDNAVRALLQFMNSLEDNPNQFIRGRQQPVIFSEPAPVILQDQPTSDSDGK